MNKYDETIELDEKLYFSINNKYGFDNIKNKYPSVRMSIYKKNDKMHIRNSSNIKLHQTAIMKEIRDYIFMESPYENKKPNIFKTIIDNVIKPDKINKFKNIRKNIYTALNIEEVDDVEENDDDDSNNIKNNNETTKFIDNNNPNKLNSNDNNKHKNINHQTNIITKFT